MIDSIRIAARAKAKELTRGLIVAVPPNTPMEFSARGVWVTCEIYIRNEELHEEEK